MTATIVTLAKPSNSWGSGFCAGQLAAVVVGVDDNVWVVVETVRLTEAGDVTVAVVVIRSVDHVEGTVELQAVTTATELPVGQRRDVVRENLNVLLHGRAADVASVVFQDVTSVVLKDEEEEEKKVAVKSWLLDPSNVALAFPGWLAEYDRPARKASQDLEKASKALSSMWSVDAASDSHKRRMRLAASDMIRPCSLPHWQ
ncbi:hypothetical protein PG991_011044 [Apiospora marii]|uniref:Uncharacterized protein n=1 Tax=Apiospora marii TaxID=335849 RepID=A0ABR1RE32_9PEZI